MSRTFLAVLATLLVASLAPSITAPVSGPPTFASVVANEAGVGEPSVLVDTTVSPPRILTVSPSTGVFVSTNGGASYFPGSTNVQTNGDASPAIDANGVIYLSGLTDAGGLTSTVPVQVSLDGGLTFTRHRELVPNAAGIECDRQWTAARGNGESVTSVRCGSEGVVWRTTDAGLTYLGPFSIATGVYTMGPLAYAPDGKLYAPYFANEGLRVARSADGGLTWQTALAAPDVDSSSFPVVAVDSAGNVYAAYEKSTYYVIGGINPIKASVFVVASTDGGVTWSAPTQVSDVPRSAIFPWIVAGAPGKVNVAYFVMNNVTAPDLGLPITTWDIEMAQSLNALAPTPTYQRHVVVKTFHTGSICTSGLACLGPQNLGFGNAPTPFDRRMLDFFEMRIDLEGRAYISYGQDRPMTNCLSSCYVGDLFLSWVDMMVARQTGGTTIA